MADQRVSISFEEFTAIALDTVAKTIKANPSLGSPWKIIIGLVLDPGAPTAQVRPARAKTRPGEQDGE